MKHTTVRWGGLVLDVVQIGTSRGRGLLMQTPATGSGGQLQDRGPEFKEVRVTVRWVRRGRDDDPVERYQQLLAMNDGKTRLLIHPIDGAFPAKMSIEDESIENGQVRVMLRFVEDRGDPRLQNNRSRPNAPAAIEAAEKAADDATMALEDGDLSADVAIESKALANSWRQPSSPRDVRTQLDRQTHAINALIDAENLRTDPDRLDAYYAMIRLSAALSMAAAALTAQGPSLITMEISGEAVTLLALCAQIYGGALAQERAAEIARLNAVRNWNVIPAGTTLVVPSA